MQGVIINRCDNSPIEMVSVSLRFAAHSLWGDNTTVTDPVYSNENGEFSISQKSFRLTGGVGGWSGSVHQWPTVELKKQGYRETGYHFYEANKFNNMVLDMEPINGCP